MPTQPPADAYTLRTCTPDDWDSLSVSLSDAFSEFWQTDMAEFERLVFEPDRTIVMVEGTEIAGSAGAFTRDMTAPGAVIPTAHVSLVGVGPTHRRRGLLTRMMHEQLNDIRQRGEAVAILWATEGRIYQRFGYGLGASRLTFETDNELRMIQLPGPVSGPDAALSATAVALANPGAPLGGRLRNLPIGEATKVLPPLYDRVRVRRPGWSSRDERWWEYVLADPESRRAEKTALRGTVHEGQSGVDGYALWRVKPHWTARGPASTVLVREVVATNPVAYKALWDFLLRFDLSRSTEFGFAAPDEPLYHLVNDPSRLSAHLTDSLWVRLTDVPAALAARRYLTPVDAVLDVTDPVLPENSGRWHLTGDTDSAHCTRTDRPADLAVQVSALGAAYLGGASLHGLAAAGRVVELTPGALQRTSAAFGWYQLPSATEVF